MNEKQLKTIKGAKYRVITDNDGVFDWGAIIQLADNPKVDATGAFYIQEGNSHGRRYMYFSEIELVELTENENVNEQLNRISSTVSHAQLTADRAIDKVEKLEERVEVLEQAAEEPEPVSQPHISEEEFAAIKVGDKIVLRSDLATGNGYGKDSAVTAMVDLAQRGVEIKVEDISSDDLRGHAEGDYWWYTHKMIAKVIPAIKPKFKVGDVISPRGVFFFARKITAVDLEKAEYKWVWADGTDPEEEHTNSIEKYDSKYTLHSSFEKPKPKFKVGDVLNRSGAGTDMDCARLVTEVDEENSEYRTQWADGTDPEHRMEYSFERAESHFIKVGGLPPRMINSEGTVITAGSYYVVEGNIYSTVIKVTDVDVEKQQYTYTSVALGGLSLDAGDTASAEESIYFRTAVPATPEQIEQFKKLENPEPAEENAPEFDNPDVEVGKVYMDDDGWMFYCDDVSKVEKHVFSNRIIYVNDVTSLNPAGELKLEDNYGCNKYREATPEEAVKLLSTAFQDKAA